MAALLAWLFASLLVLSYLYLLAGRLERSRFSRKKAFPSSEELVKEGAEWREIDVLQGSKVAQPTHRRYLVTGACGSLGVWLVGILHRRGERNIFCLDFALPPASIRGLSGITFIQCDITNQQKVKDAFRTARPDV